MEACREGVRPRELRGGAQSTHQGIDNGNHKGTTSGKELLIIHKRGGAQRKRVGGKGKIFWYLIF